LLISTNKDEIVFVAFVAEVQQNVEVDVLNGASCGLSK